MSAEITVVTGAARGIGLAIARERASAGRTVAMLDVDAEALTRAAGELGGEAPRLACPCDVSSPAEVTRALTRVQEAGVVTELVNNAGLGGPFHRVDEVDDGEWERVFGANVRGVFLTCRALLPAMRDAGRGRVVNVASVQGLTGAPLSSTYVASKHAVVGYTRAIAAEWGPYGVTCNAVCPGYVDTRMGIPADDGTDARAAILAGIPAGRQARTGEIATAVAFLLSPGAGAVNGACLVVDGGMTAIR